MDIRLTDLLPTDLTAASLEETGDGPPVLRNLPIIQAGVSRNRRRYSAELLQRDGPAVFEAVPGFLTNHRQEAKDVTRLAGVWRNVRFTGNALRADFHASPEKVSELRHAVWAAKELGMDRVGVSIDTSGNLRAERTESGMVHEVTSLVRTPHTSIDLVLNPAAGGRLSEATDTRSLDMLELISRLTESALSGMSPEALRLLVGEATEEDLKAANPTLYPRLMEILTEPETKTTGTTTQTTTVGTGPQTLSEAEFERRLDARLAEVEKRANERLQVAECAAVLAEKLTEARDLDEVSRELLSSKYAGRMFVATDLDAEIKRVRDLRAKANPRYPNVPGGTATVTEAFDLNKARLEATCLAKANRVSYGQEMQVGNLSVRPFTKLSEMVFAFEPELRWNWVDRPEQAMREACAFFQWGGGPLHLADLTEDVASTTFNQAWADVLHRTLQKVVTDPTAEMNFWRGIVSSVIPFADLTNTYKLVRVGEVGVLPTVAEGAPYQEVTAATDDQQAVAIVKKGGLYTFNWEAFLRDDVNVLARIPSVLGRAFAWTVNDYILSTVFQANTGTGMTMDADSTVLYHANHNNIATSAFTVADLNTARIKMPKQTDPDSGKRKNYRARYLMYATPDLDEAIWEALSNTFKVNPLSTSGSQVNLKNFVNQVLGLIPVPVIYPTATTTRWELVADQADTDTLVVGFLGGRDTPDVFVQDMETTGSRFTADKITYKIRGTVAAAAANYRGFVRGNL